MTCAGAVERALRANQEESGRARVRSGRTTGTPPAYKSRLDAHRPSQCTDLQGLQVAHGTTGHPPAPQNAPPAHAQAPPSQAPPPVTVTIARLGSLQSASSASSARPTLLAAHSVSPVSVLESNPCRAMSVHLGTERGQSRPTSTDRAPLSGDTSPPSAPQAAAAAAAPAARSCLRRCPRAPTS